MNNTPKNMMIKHRGWHNVTLTGDLLTGDTFQVKDWIKKYLNGRWDGQRKGWVVDLDAVARYTTGGGETLMVS
jgi:hypothetical protein